MKTDTKMDVLIVEDEGSMADLHAELVSQFVGLQVVGVATTLAEAKALAEQHHPQLILLDNYLPDGQGITLISSPDFNRVRCSVIFITAASDMHTCSQAIRSGAFDYILKPVSLKRLRQSLQNFICFSEQQREWKVVDQQNVDLLYQLQSKNSRQQRIDKGIDAATLTRIKQLFAAHSGHRSVDEVMTESGLSKTTVRRYLEYCVRTGYLQVELLYGNIGHPRRLYLRR
ncbi:response regulator [Tatumella saanichensis]|uniref:response regulator n=1 Tax=Tatumella saanichensis TaxID=480813 RepID=UPI0004A43358|nr:response regulator [Tatumella saanichensis]